MPKATVRNDLVAFQFGQAHGLKAFAHALLRTHPNSDALLSEFRASSQNGLDQLRAVPVPHGAIRAYQQLCDELTVVLAKEVSKSPRANRREILF